MAFFFNRERRSCPWAWRHPSHYAVRAALLQGLSSPSGWRPTVRSLQRDCSGSEGGGGGGALGGRSGPQHPSCRDLVGDSRTRSENQRGDRACGLHSFSAFNLQPAIPKFWHQVMSQVLREMKSGTLKPKRPRKRQLQLQRLPLGACTMGSTKHSMDLNGEVSP